jgi:hypothetical protein
MSAYFFYPLLFVTLICLVNLIVDVFWSLWDDCDEDEIHDLEKYRRSDDSN